MRKIKEAANAQTAIPNASGKCDKCVVTEKTNKTPSVIFVARDNSGTKSKNALVSKTTGVKTSAINCPVLTAIPVVSASKMSVDK